MDLTLPQARSVDRPFEARLGPSEAPARFLAAAVWPHDIGHAAELRERSGVDTPLADPLDDERVLPVSRDEDVARPEA